MLPFTGEGGGLSGHGHDGNHGVVSASALETTEMEVR